MTIGAVSGSTAATDMKTNSLSIEDFLQILLTQLTYQDPLKPMDNQQFMAQMAQFTTLQQAQDTNAKIDQMINNQSASQSIGLLGKTVQLAGKANTTGVVSGLSFAGAVPSLTLALSNGQSLAGVSLSEIATVR